MKYLILLMTLTICCTDSGLQTKYHFNLKKKSEGLIIDGQKQGEWKYWDKSGNLEMIINYQNGLKHGDFSSFHQNKINSYAFYTHDTATHIILFYPNEKKLTEKYFKHGKIDSVALSWFRNGNLQLFEEYDEGEKTGLWYEFNQEGDTISIKSYKNDSLIYQK